MLERKEERDRERARERREKKKKKIEREERGRVEDVLRCRNQDKIHWSS